MSSIITITACAKLSTTTSTEINLNDLKNDIEDFFKNNHICEHNISSGYTTKKKNETSIITSTVNKIISKGSTGLFYNCIGLKLIDILTSEKISCNVYIKFFKNRSVHITGLRDDSNIIVNIIEKMTNCKLIDLKYVMIRSKFSMHREIQLNKLEDNMNNDPFFTYCSYIPSHYRGLILKSDIGKASVFGTGMMLLSTTNFENIDILINKIENIVNQMK